MLQHLGRHISEARERARRCNERARATTDEGLRAELADLEKGWLELANQFETLKSMENFLLDRSKQSGIP